MVLSISVEDLFRTPQWYPDGIDVQNDLLQFIQMDRHCYHQSAFLSSGRALRIDRSPIQVHLSQLTGYYAQYIKELSAPEQTNPNCHYIFHTAFCGSTLLSRLLDIPGKTLCLREPQILQTAAMRERRGNQPSLLNLALGLIHRRWGGERLIIKPDDFCNNLAARLIRLNPDNRGLLLYSSLESFMISVLKNKGRRQWLRNAFQVAYLDRQNACIHDTVKEDIQPDQLNDADLAAFVWSVKISQAEQQLKSAEGQIRSLNVNNLLIDIGSIMTQLNKFMHLQLDEQIIKEQLNSDSLKQHSKSGEIYDPDNASEENERLRREFESEIDCGMNWLEKHSGLSPVIELPYPMTP